MDRVRPELRSDKLKRRYFYVALGVLVAIGTTGAVSRLKPAAPSVERATIWTDTVKRGSMLIAVRGLGTLQPENTVLIPAATDARVERRYLLPGTPVKAGTLILDLSDPQLQQEALDAEYQLKGAQASYERTKAQLQNQLMDKRAQAAQISSQYQTAKLTAESNQKLSASGLVSDLILKQSQVQVEELAKQNELAEKQVDIFASSIDSQLAVQQADIDQKRALYALKKSQLEQLHVRAGIDGVLQELNVDVGQRVAAGAPLAKVTQPAQLKAALKIAETQARDLQVGQTASIDTHNGTIAGHVMRIDPSATNGTRTVDVKLDGPLPRGAVPDLNVEGTIEIERLKGVLMVGRPVHGDAESAVGLFKLSSDGKQAVRVQVELGKTSVDAVEIRSGLQSGDRVILSDMSAWDSFDRLQLK